MAKESSQLRRKSDRKPKRMTSNYSEKPYASIKELLICLLLAALMWSWSFSVLLPLFLLLAVSSRLRAKWFALIYSACLSKLFPGLDGLRKKLFEIIYDECDHNKRLKILEIGAGSGANFQFYSENHLLTILDANPNFEQEIKETLKSYPNIKIDRIVFSDVRDMKAIRDKEFDIVVGTFLFCSVSNTLPALEEIRRVLKPGGKFAFMEHVGYPKDHLAYWIQKLMSPIWQVYFNGCRLDRNMIQRLKEAHFTDVSCKTFYPSFLPMFVRAQVLGIATK